MLWILFIQSDLSFLQALEILQLNWIKLPESPWTEAYRGCVKCVNTQKWLWTHLQMPSCISRRVSLFVGIAQQKQASGMWVTNQTFLTHSFPRPDKREERTGGEGWKKRREQHRGSLLVLELLTFFRAVAFFQAHIIQSNLPSVTMPFFTFEDDLERERTHGSSLLCSCPMSAHLPK